ncbi:MAG: hypothetical protein ACI4UN_07870 [Muribaculaceae bacterium]
MAETVEIATADELNAFATRVNAGETTLDAKLTADIDATAEFTCIGEGEGKAYAGTFDGDNHSITVNISGWDNRGVFSHINGATIKNLVVEGAVTGAYVNACLVANVENGTNLIENVTNNATFTIGDDTSYDKCAGFIAVVSAGNVTIKNSENNGTITGNNYTAGFIGLAQGESAVVIENCVNNGEIIATAGLKCGGIMGEQWTGQTTIKGCVNTANITAVKNTGGIIGGSNTTLTVSECLNTGNVTCSGDDAGGMLGGKYGEATMTFERCINEGNIKANGEAGGLIGADWNVAGTVNLMDCGNSGIATSGWAAAGLIAYQAAATFYTVINCANFVEANTFFAVNIDRTTAVNVLNPCWGHFGITYDLAEVTTGALCVKLNNGRETAVWGQTLGTDAHPWPFNLEEHKPVYVGEDGSYSNDPTTGVIDAIAPEAAGDGIMYNVAGQRVGKDAKGIVIINGKKYLKR